MQRRRFPILVYPSAAVRRSVGPDLDVVAGLALRAVLKNRRSLEIAHQQISYRSHCLAFSSRIGTDGDLILELDVGDPRLADRIILEEDLVRARRFAQTEGAKPPSRRR
jgi:hypothetical protein